jgi:uncharacterized protein YpmS
MTLLLIIKILVVLLLVDIIWCRHSSINKLEKQIDALKHATIMSNRNELEALCRRYKLTNEETESIIGIYNLHININSLHNNQKMLSSSIKDLYRAFRKYDKNFKRQIRTETRGKEAGTEET